MTALTILDSAVDGPHGPVPFRSYQRADATRRADVGLVWIHGGGFQVGDLDVPEADWVSRCLASAGVSVVSVDYRLAVDGVHFPVPATTSWRSGPGRRATALSASRRRPGTSAVGAPAGTWPPRCPSRPATDPCPCPGRASSSTRCCTTSYRRPPRRCAPVGRAPGRAEVPAGEDDGAEPQLRRRPAPGDAPVRLSGPWGRSGPSPHSHRELGPRRPAAVRGGIRGHLALAGVDVTWFVNQERLTGTSTSRSRRVRSARSPGCWPAAGARRRRIRTRGARAG